MDTIKKTERILKAISERTRLQILYLLSKRPLCVCEMTSILELSQSTISGHLKVLRDADIVDIVKNGLFIEYHINRENDFLNNVLKTVLNELEKDDKLKIENEKSLKSNRHALCKK